MGLKAFLMYDMGLQRLSYAIKRKKFIEKYYSASNVSDNNEVKKQIVYMADGRISPGGLGDRIHGMISLYKFCKENGFEFKANFCSPFRLHDYFAPNEYNWDVEPESLTYDIQKAEPLLIFCTFGKYHGTLVQEATMQHKYLEEMTSGQKQYHVYTNAHFAHTPEVYSKLFHELFVPTKPLQDAINWNKERIGGDYVAVTLRFQNLLGDFKEANFKALPEDERQGLIDKVKNKIKDLHDSRHPDKKFLVTSDSRAFLDTLADLDFVYTIPGKVVHMTYTPEHNFNLHLKSFVDLMVLADAQKLYLLVTDEMFRSGFAQSASFINAKPYEEIIF